MIYSKSQLTKSKIIKKKAVLVSRT